ncbi:hypothetical protein [Terrihabitans rhizophilus]|uniref:Uncharacterized protein n=1 Tax=Terrihabitans rhizophilus TaxID=3092662 RepID=A0ABU4RQP7_9HYPH|nr:hypothetical protein [Terrihabitans sp. PJ23]MDX6806921.1 hypothetical protein [Terrihabitans sp. PJ23]
MLIRFGFEAVSTAAIKKLEMIEDETAAAGLCYQVTYLDNDVETFRSTFDLDEQFAVPVAAPPGYFIVHSDTSRREQVLAFLIDPLTARTATPTPVTATGACVLDGKRGLLAPDGGVSTIIETFDDYDDFAAARSEHSPSAHLDGAGKGPHTPPSKLDGAGRA